MSNSARNPLTYAAIPLLSTGAGFAAAGAMAQPAFGYSGAAMMVSGAVLLIIGLRRNRRKA
jgi:membrane-bound ClpP family serine protease